MLVALNRSGPLRQRIAKGYVVLAPDGTVRDGAVAALVAAPPRLPAMPTGGRPVLRADPLSPATVWIDTGQVSLYDPAARAAVGRALAESVAAVAERLRPARVLLLPSGWHPGGGRVGSAPLTGDLHSVEAISPVQRELLCNLVRELSAPMIALTGRQLFGPGHAPPGGSARLSRATDQVTTRYIASFSPQHLERIRAGLRHEEQLARLEAMDVNPLGAAEVQAYGDLTLRLVDAQLTVASAMAHALVLQALSMSARELERTGHRVWAVPQPLLERNRSRAIAHGLAAEFDREARRPHQRAGGGGSRPAPEQRVGARSAVLRMLQDLMPYFRQLDATPAELGQLFHGLRLTADGTAPFVRNENDLLARWREWDGDSLSAERLAAGLRSPDWLVTDHVGAANHAQSAGSTSAARVWLAEQLSPPRPEPEQPRPEPSRPVQSGPVQSGPVQSRPDRSGSRAGQGQAGRSATQSQAARAEQALLAVLCRADADPEQAAGALRRYGRSAGGSLDLNRALRARDRDEAKELRRLLRPHSDRRFRTFGPLTAWDQPTAQRALRCAVENGVALLHWDVPEADRAALRTALRTVGPPPDAVRCVTLTDVAYTAKAEERRGRFEVLLVLPAEEAAP